jgi:hypothetical protein
MTTYTIEREIWVPTPIDEVFAFFSDASNLETMTPDWLRFEIVTPTPIDMHAGATIEYRIRWRFVALRWLTEIVEWSPPYRFVDVQTRGPYALWHHTHEFGSDRRRHNGPRHGALRTAAGRAGPGGAPVGRAARSGTGVRPSHAAGRGAIRSAFCRRSRAAWLTRARHAIG